MALKASISLSAPLVLEQAEAERLGLSLSKLLTVDLVRYRALAAAAMPDLDAWEWSLLEHVLDGIEALHAHAGRDDLPSSRRIVAEIDEWADGALDDETIRAGSLREKVAGWSPLAIAGVLFRLRAA